MCLRFLFIKCVFGSHLLNVSSFLVYWICLRLSFIKCVFGSRLFNVDGWVRKKKLRNHELIVSVFLWKLVFSLLLTWKYYCCIINMKHSTILLILRSFLWSYATFYHYFFTSARDLERQCLTNAQCSIRECVKMVGILLTWLNQIGRFNYCNYFKNKMRYWEIISSDTIDFVSKIQLYHWIEEKRMY